MTEDDLDRVLELENAIFPNPWRRSFFKSDMVRPQGLSVVAELEGRVVGYAVAWGTDEVHLANLAVEQVLRNRGIGHELMQAVFAFAEEHHAESMYLEVRLSNKAARQFYGALGFVPTYLRKGYYENGEDAIVMEKDVEPK